MEDFHSKRKNKIHLAILMIIFQFLNLLNIIIIEDDGTYLSEFFVIFTVSVTIHMFICLNQTSPITFNLLNLFELAFSSFTLMLRKSELETKFIIDLYQLIIRFFILQMFMPSSVLNFMIFLLTLTVNFSEL